jgi:hypothetical protein
MRRRRGLVGRDRLVATGMARQGYDLQLTRYDERGWRATFYSTGMERSLTSATGTGWERTPCHATQRAAWEVLKKAEIILTISFTLSSSIQSGAPGWPTNSRA